MERPERPGEPSQGFSPQIFYGQNFNDQNFFARASFGGSWRLFFGF
jgi:hypothetical protein